MSFEPSGFISGAPSKYLCHEDMPKCVDDSYAHFAFAADLKTN